MKRSAITRKTPLKKKRGTSTAKLKRDALRAWGAYIHARDQSCRYCGRADGKLDAHHVMVRTFAATCTDENNGVLVCYRDHQLLHSDPHAAVVFYTMRYGIQGYAALRKKAYDGKDKVLRADYWRAEIERLSAALRLLGGDE